MTLFRILLLVVLAFILKSCAQQKPPTGGPQDIEPPEVLSTTPENFGVHFDAKRIEIEFNEFVQLRNLSQQLVINPAMDERPDFRLKGKKLIIDLNSPLQEKTTYVINFGDAVVDLTEGNKAEGLQYVFSTGAFLDSLRFAGRIIDAFEKKPVAEVLVMLYTNPSDTMPFKGVPDYFGKTDEQGNFEINYIRENEYSVFALKDENSNYRYNPPTEQIGFLDSLIVPGFPDSTNIPVSILMFSETDTTQYIDTRESTFYGQHRTILYQPSDSVSVEPLNDEYELYTEHGVVGDTITTWFLNRNEFPELESLDMIVYTSPNFVDTVSWRLSRGKDDEDPALVIKDNLLFNFNPFSPIRLTFNHPIESADTAPIELYRDSVPVAFEWQTTESPRKFEIHHDWEFGTSYRIFVPDSIFFDVFNLTNDTLDKTVTTREERYFGNLQFNFNFDVNEPVILEMLNERGEVIKELIPEKPGIITFKNMAPGKYSMRVIYDLNGNGEWDTGSYLEKRHPEPVEVYENSIQIRSNWDMELEWDLREESEESEETGKEE